MAAHVTLIAVLSTVFHKRLKSVAPLSYFSPEVPFFGDLLSTYATSAVFQWGGGWVCDAVLVAMKTHQSEEGNFPNVLFIKKIIVDFPPFIGAVLAGRLKCRRRGRAAAGGAGRAWRLRCVASNTTMGSASSWPTGSAFLARTCSSPTSSAFSSATMTTWCVQPHHAVAMLLFFCLFFFFVFVL